MKKRQPNQPTPQWQQQQDRPPIKCHGCGGLGHIERFCRNKKTESSGTSRNRPAVTKGVHTSTPGPESAAHLASLLYSSESAESSDSEAEVFSVTIEDQEVSFATPLWGSVECQSQD